MKKTIIAAVAAAAVGLGAALTPAAAQVRIGISYPATGGQASLGVPWANGAELAVRQANAAGGIDGQKIELVRQDDQGDARQGTLVAQKFGDDPSILAVIANFSSGVTLPTSDIYNRYGIVQVTNASNPRVTQNGYTNLFRPIGNDLQQGSVPADYAAGVLGLKKVALLHDKSAYGQGIAEVFQKTFEGKGGKVTSIQGVNADDVDFTPMLSKIKTETPDAVFYAGTMPSVALIPKQLKVLGIDVVYLTGDNGQDPEFGAVAGAGAEGTIVSTQAPPYDSSEGLKKFAAEYKAAFNAEPGPFSIYGYNFATIIIDAARRAKPLDRANLIAEIRETNLDSLTGPIAFTDTGELKTAQIFLYKFHDGKFGVVWPKS